ncbi:hypothetical protein LMG27198_47200 [Methylocystis echinoides]|uniref:Resolvase HTH domain-containing protein n=1 Tax=Methylocystis echinoides TaxID=29468 RepID=A0A9W6GZ13_9HYPH|nr:hypothetical protein LMG27198_47200 [Methylocystis echinoides]
MSGYGDCYGPRCNSNRCPQRTRAELKAALARGRKGGRPKALSEDKLAKARAAPRSGDSVAEMSVVSRATIYTHLPESQRRAQEDV